MRGSVTYTHWREILVMKEDVVLDPEYPLKGSNCATITYGNSLMPNYI